MRVPYELTCFVHFVQVERVQIRAIRLCEAAVRANRFRRIKTFMLCDDFRNRKGRFYTSQC